MDRLVKKVLIATMAVALAATPASALSKKKLHNLHRLQLLSGAVYAATTAPVPLPPAPPAPAKMTVAAARANPIELLQRFSVDDLEAALADAQAQKPLDQVAATCYPALIKIVQDSVPNLIVPTNPGMFLGGQRSRDTKNVNTAMLSQSGPLAGLNVACAPLVLDPLNTLVTIGVTVGVVSQ
jgi:hypothetical protein